MSKLWSNNPSLPPPATAFSGETYKPARDYARLTGQLLAVFDLMKDGKWRTLQIIGADLWFYHFVTASEASISARLRDLRKTEYGGHTVERRPVANGLHEYRLLVKGSVAA